MLRAIHKPGSAALAFLLAASMWFVIGTLYGMVSAMDLVSPELFNNIGALAFGRSRPAHVDTVLFGFVTPMLIGCGLFYLPFLLRRPLWSEPLAWLGFVLWNLGVLSGPISFAMGFSQGREYAEYVWIGDVAIWLALVVLLFDGFMTLLTRRENLLYISVWYFTGTLLWMVGTYFIGNVMWHPRTGAMSGMIDTIIQWFYGHNLPGLLLTPLAVGAAYFVIPRVTRTPLYSHTLSLIGFWTLVALYTHIGGHHLMQAPLPNWLKTMAMVDSLAMVIPVFAVLLNLWMTARGRAGLLLQDPAGRFVIIGTVWYLLTCIQGPLQSLPFLQRVTHFNNWTIGHAHIAVLGFSGYIALGGLWHILPMMCGRKLYSNRLVMIQFGLITFGLMGFFLVLTTAGLIQGHAWYNGEIVYRVLPEISVYMALRAGLGLFIVTAALIGLYNVIMTLLHGEPLGPDFGQREAAS